MPGLNSLGQAPSRKRTSSLLVRHVRRSIVLLLSLTKTPTSPVLMLNDTLMVMAAMVNWTTPATNLTIVLNLTTETTCDSASGVTCSSTHLSGGREMCSRLAPPPVPPWLLNSPSRVYERIKHCRSWTLYQELCNQGADNSSLVRPRHVQTTDADIAIELERGPNGVQWIIPGLALVVVFLLLVLAGVLYKYYHHPTQRRMYRVAGTGRPLKGPQVPRSWAGEAQVENDTIASYLFPANGRDHERYSRSPVCRLLEQTQYIATPTEVRTRSRPSGPPAFTSPAYVLPALAWLRLPLMQLAWPGTEGNDPAQVALYETGQACPGETSETVYQWPKDSDRDLTETDLQASRQTTHVCSIEMVHHYPKEIACCSCSCQSSLYNAGNRCQYCSGDVPYHWPQHHQDQFVAGCEQAGEEHEYSEIWEEQPGPPLSQYNGISLGSAAGTNAYTMPCDCPHVQPACGHLPGSLRSFLASNDHQYEQIWQGCDAMSDGTISPSIPSSPTRPGTCTDGGWLSRYRLPSPRTLSFIRASNGRPCHRNWSSASGVTPEDITSDSELLPEYFAHEPLGRGTRDQRVANGRGAVEDRGRAEVNFANPVYKHKSPKVTLRKEKAPVTSRLWGIFGWKRR